MKNAPRCKAVYVLWGSSWRLENNLKFNTFEELKTYLIENTDKLFGWINDNVEDYKDYRELPNFKDVETVRDINTILDDYIYGWWFLKVKIITAVKDENEIE